MTNCTSRCPEAGYLTCGGARNHDGSCAAGGYRWHRGRGHRKPCIVSRPAAVERERALANIETDGFVEYPLIFGVHRLPARERRCPAWPPDTEAMRDARFLAACKRFAARIARS